MQDMSKCNEIVDKRTSYVAFLLDKEQNAFSLRKLCINYSWSEGSVKLKPENHLF